MDVAFSDIIHSKWLHFSFGADTKFDKVLDIARRLPTSYKLLGRGDVSGKFLDAISSENWKESPSSILKKDRDFWISLCSYRATIIKLQDVIDNFLVLNFSMLSLSSFLQKLRQLDCDTGLHWHRNLHPSEPLWQKLLNWRGKSKNCKNFQDVIDNFLILSFSMLPLSPFLQKLRQLDCDLGLHQCCYFQPPEPPWQK